MNILITGATGFIGKNLTKRLLQNGNNLFCTLLYGEENPFPSALNIKSLVHKSETPEITMGFLKENEINGIIHLASFVHSGNHQFGEIKQLIESNILFGAELLECAVKSGVKWFINTSTYWQHYQGKEYSPVNLYAATKQAFMDIAALYWQLNQIQFVTIELYDTYGPDDNRPKIFNIWKQISKSGETLDMSLGEQIIDISYIDDIIAAFEILSIHLERENQEINSGDVYSIKSTQRYTLRELAKIFEKVTETKLNINWGSKPYKSREIIIPYEGQKLIPGWEPQITIVEGIKMLICER